ncbi:MAG TPA: flavodoxin family protein [Chloroflexota bacterium]|nr:flavodoxin family protein [Chloroflexota bacterium]
MQTLVIYDSKFGNTEKVAGAIARGAGPVSEVRITTAAEAARAIEALFARPDLVLVGGPTQNRGPSAGLRGFVDSLPEALRGIRTACFDTRYRGPTWLMGSAAAVVTRALAKSGAEVVAPPESFFIVRRGATPLRVLEPGEIERAESWGRAIATSARDSERVGLTADITR